MIIRIAAAAIVVSLLVPITAAQTSASTNYPVVMQNMGNAGALEVDKQFPTSKDGLTGYIVKRDGYQTVVDSEDGHLILGPLFGPQGRKSVKAVRPTTYAETERRTGNQVTDRSTTDYSGLGRRADALHVRRSQLYYCHRIYQQVQPLVRLLEPRRSASFNLLTATPFQNCLNVHAVAPC